MESLTGAKYFINLVDDFSRCTLAYLMRDKSQTLSHLKKFLAMVKTQYHRAMKRMRSNNGTEFLSLSCQSLFSELGIIHQRSCAYTPQQNKVVQRKHRSILQVARSLLIQSDMSIKFWGEAILHAVYLINRLPSFSIGWKSPYQMLFKKSVVYEVIKCVCVMLLLYILKRISLQLESKCVFVGYSHGQKGYKVYDIDVKTLTVSRNVIFYEIVSKNVIFYETIYPFQTQLLNSHNQSANTPLPMVPTDLDEGENYCPTSFTLGIAHNQPL